MNDLIEGLNEVQAEAVVHNEGPLLILSGAGSAEKPSRYSKPRSYSPESPVALRRLQMRCVSVPEPCSA